MKQRASFISSFPSARNEIVVVVKIILNPFIFLVLKFPKFIHGIKCLLGQSEREEILKVYETMKE